MASLDSLPPDQRAVLQLVLQRGHTYDEIAGMLSIDRAAVRERALFALDALGPGTRVPAERRALITDYLLGQLPPQVARDTRSHLAESASERAWTRVVASELTPLAAGGLPEIPSERAAPSAPSAPAAAPQREPRAGREREPARAQEPRAPQPEPRATAAAAPSGYGSDRPPPSNRRGGAILLAIAAVVVVVAVILIVVLSNGSSSNSSTTAASTASTSTPATGTPTTGTSTTAARPIAQVNLVSPSGNKHTAGIAEVIRQGTNTGLVIVGQGLPANTSHDAYAVWLYNSASDSHLLGFVNPGVKANGKLQTAGVLPSNASHYHQLLVTLETQSRPAQPGTIVLEGALSIS